ncbi:MAG TPA: ATP-binding protein, partial [Dehalococcoidia bacterium]|nr:ATP-binding protein [Dehalococcoidia bacterium]
MSRADSFRIGWQQARWICDPNSLDFKCTDELAPLDHFIGQARALESIRFGLEVDKPGYNLFVTGLTGTGKASIIRAHLERVIEDLKARETRPPIRDWCYVHHFDDPDRPHAISLPQGMGKTLRNRLSDTLPELQAEIPKVFKSEEYQSQQHELEEAGRRTTQQIMAELEQAAKKANFAIQVSPAGVSIFPMADTRPLTHEEYEGLSPAERQALDDRRNQLMQRTQDTMMRIRDVERDAADKVRALERVAADERVSVIFRELMDSYQEVPELKEFLTHLVEYVLDNLNLFKESEGRAETPFAMPSRQGAGGPALARNPFLPFEVNVLVDNSGVATVPVVVEANPNWGNLFGRIERRAVMGAYFSDHTMLKPGAVHLANGGYLVFNARDMLAYPGVWEGLKRVIRNRAITLEDPTELGGFFVPQGLRPQPIPLDVKVIITGDETLYRLFTGLDYEDFWDLFKVKAEFDSRIELSPENLRAYCAFICRTCTQENLRQLDAGAAAQVLEHAARLVADQTRLSARFGQIKDLLIESDHWAKRDASPTVLAKHVEQALAHKWYRLNLIQERLQELIAEGTLLLSMTGSEVGQVNGLSVYDLGDFAFGLPGRITAQTFAGQSRVINIEREAA